MNNSLDRLLGGMVTSLQNEIIPRLDDEFARGQAYAAVDLLNNLRPRLDWAMGPLGEQVQAQLATARQVAALAPDAPAVPAEAEALSSGEALRRRRDALDEHLCVLQDWAASAPAAIKAPVEAALGQYMREQVRREVSLAAKPLFGEIAGNTGKK